MQLGLYQTKLTKFPKVYDTFLLQTPMWTTKTLILSSLPDEVFSPPPFPNVITSTRSHCK